MKPLTLGAGQFWVHMFLQLRKEASLRNCKNCDHNCEDHSSFDFTSAVHNMIYFICIIHLHIFSREHMNPKLTCSQRQWLHSSVGRASHRYREVTGSSPVEILNFFQASLCNFKNCDHNCEDHSSFDFTSAVHI